MPVGRGARKRRHCQEHEAAQIAQARTARARILSPSLGHAGVAESLRCARGVRTPAFVHPARRSEAQSRRRRAGVCLRLTADAVTRTRTLESALAGRRNEREHVVGDMAAPASRAAEDEEMRKVRKPFVSLADAPDVLARCGFGLVGAADWVELDSYDDRNFSFAARTAEGAPAQRFVLKIHNGATDEAFVKAQTAVLAHVASHCSLACPTVLATCEGERVAVVLLPLRSGTPCRHMVRVLTYVPGQLLGAMAAPTVELLHSAGTALGQLSQALCSFDDVGMHREHLWDLRRTPLLARFVDAVAEPARRALAEEAIARFARDVVPVLGDLRCACLHNDANEANTLVALDGSAVVGFIDWGDAVHSALVFEPAIAAAYAAIVGRPGVAAAAQALLRGYHAVLPLTDTERSLLHTLVCARISQSLVLGAYAASRDPANTYVLTTSATGWTALAALLAMPPEHVDAFNALAAP